MGGQKQVQCSLVGETEDFLLLYLGELTYRLSLRLDLINHFSCPIVSP